MGFRLFCCSEFGVEIVVGTPTTRPKTPVTWRGLRRTDSGCRTATEWSDLRSGDGGSVLVSEPCTNATLNLNPEEPEFLSGGQGALVAQPYHGSDGPLYPWCTSTSMTVPRFLGTSDDEMDTHEEGAWADFSA